MKNVLFIVFRVLCFLVLAVHVSSWFFKFSNQTNQLMNIAMFTLIGIAYVIVGYAWDDKFIKSGIISCGVILIVINFFATNVALEIVEIICILIPMLIVRFHKEGNLSEAE